MEREALDRLDARMRDREAEEARQALEEMGYDEQQRQLAPWRRDGWLFSTELGLFLLVLAAFAVWGVIAALNG